MTSRSTLRAYGISLAAVGTAVLIRLAVSPWLGPYAPLATLYGAVAVAVWLSGYRAALVAAVAGYVAADLIFILPARDFDFLSRENVLGLALYLFSCSLIAGFGEALRRERRRAQTTSSQLRIVTEGIAAGAAHCSRDMRYLWVNQPYSDWIQIPADELIGKSIADVVGPEAFAQLLPYVKRVLDGQTVHYEKEVAFKGKTPCWVSTNYTPTRDENGVVDGWVAVVLDISAHKHAEEELVRSRQQISADFDALTRLQGVANRCGAADNQFDECLHVILDAAIAFTHCDRGHLQLLDPDNTVLRLVSHRGFEPPFVEHFRLLDSKDPSACGHAMLEHRRVVVEDVAHNNVFAGELSQTMLLDAGVRAVQSTPLFTSKGQLIGVISTHSAKPRRFEERELRWMDVLARQAADYVDRKRIEEALQDAGRRKDEFLAMLSHELRNPLAPVGYAIEILKRDDATPSQMQKAREVIERQVRQMARLLDDLMDVSRITRGTISLRKQRVELRSIVNDAVEAARPLIEQSGHTLHVDIPARSIVLDADPTRISQVLINLLNNAAKYTERGGRIELSAARQNETVVIGVKDTGLGIPADMLQHIFELFAQEERSIERSRGGLGIGLTLARRLVALHGGELDAQSDGPGLGSEFTIRLPAAQEQYAGAARISPEEIPTTHPLRILVVDDNEDSAESMAMFLSLTGHEVQTAHDGLQAVERAAEFQPAAVLLDIGLPNLNGYEAAQRIRAQRGKDIVLVALTGWGQEEDRRRSKQAGFDHHLTKPVELDELRRLLSTARSSSPRP